MCNSRLAALLTLVGLITLNSCGAGNQISTIAGTASVDGAAVERGTIHFRSNASPSSNGGASVTNGQFQVTNDEGFAAGQYQVVLQAFRKTGRVINDPQKGKVEETASVPLRDSPQAVTLTLENAASLALDFSAAK